MFLSNEEILENSKKEQEELRNRIKVGDTIKYVSGKTDHHTKTYSQAKVIKKYNTYFLCEEVKSKCKTCFLYIHLKEKEMIKD